MERARRSREPPIPQTINEAHQLILEYERYRLVLKQSAGLFIRMFSIINLN